jgi:hypothetical protein
MSICFETVIEIRGVNPFVGVSSSQANALKPGWRKPLPVLVRINGDSAIAWRTNMMPDGNGNFYLYLHGSMRKASGTKVGECSRLDSVRGDADVLRRVYRAFYGAQQTSPAWRASIFAGLARRLDEKDLQVPGRMCLRGKQRKPPMTTSCG